MTHRSLRGFEKAQTMFSKGIIIVAITKQGTETALKIKEALKTLEYSSRVFAPAKYAKPGIVALDQKFSEFIKKNYDKVSGIVAVMAAGIVVRAVAPLL